MFELFELFELFEAFGALPRRQRREGLSRLAAERKGGATCTDAGVLRVEETK